MFTAAAYRWLWGRTLTAAAAAVFRAARWSAIPAMPCQATRLPAAMHRRKTAGLLMALLYTEALFLSFTTRHPLSILQKLSGQLVPHPFCA